MIDRKTIPGIRTATELNLVHPEQVKLTNGIPVMLIPAGSEPVCKIDFVFEAGSRYQDKVFQASLTNQMMPEGITGMTGGQIAELFEFYGSYFNVSADRDEADLTIHTLEKYLGPVLDLTQRVITEPIFPEDELSTIVANRIQSMKVDEQRVESQARRHFNRIAFGDNHPYGIVGEISDLETITRADLEQFHSKRYSKGNCRILITGPDPLKYLTVIDKLFGSVQETGTPNEKPEGLPAVQYLKRTSHIPVEGTVQTAIRIGKPLFGRTHPDFMDLTIANCILGGYFGSRLMSNIREEKGYTYGVSSHLAAFRDGGFFMIGTTVGADVSEPATAECYKEVARLMEEPVPADELERVRNYLVGQLQRSVDGPFQIADQFRPLWMNQLDLNYLSTFLKRIYSITPEEVQAVTRKHLDPSTLSTVTAGPNKAEN